MSKLKLQLETLAVESFTAGGENAALRGTVRGAATQPGGGCEPTQDYSCRQPCNPTIGGWTCGVNCATATTTE